MISDTWYKGPSNYTLAGVDTFCALQDKFIREQSNGKQHTSDSLAAFLSHSVNRYLYSYGSCLNYKTKKLPANYSDKIVAQVDKINAIDFMKDTVLKIDSGGFQVSMGAIKTSDMPVFIQMYHDFIRSNYEKFDYAFMLDLPPGPGSGEIFSSYQQIEDLNRLSYQATSTLPKEVKEQMIYIHHFRTPSLYKTWTKFLFSENLAEGHNYFGTGGIVANMATDLSIPIIIYSIPLSSVLRYVKSKGMKSFKFHVLGGANFQDIMYHKLFSYHIKKVHDIDCQITYDSSSIFKGLAIGRFIPVFNEQNRLIKMDLRSNALDLRFQNNETIRDRVYILLNEMASKYGFGHLDPINDPIYDMERDTFSRSVQMYLMLYMFRVYRYIELLIEYEIQTIYPMYESGQINDFDRECFRISQNLNQGKITRKQKAKTYSIYKSLNILTDLDENYNEHLINKFMAADDLSLVASDIYRF